MNIEIWSGNITRFAADAIVNAANSSLLGGGGVDGAIHRRGGPSILAACRQLRATSLRAGLPPGQAVATGAGQLPAKWVIHTVGPVYSGPNDGPNDGPDDGPDDGAATLASCYRECLRVADELGAKSIAFPTISAGAYGWPVAQATRIAVKTVLATPSAVDLAVMVAFNAAAEAGYRAALTASRPA